jgi:hypothetical protein|tara:strand:- start:968 stop:1264 length:297 start_codon:yes stop_codon:yes gene_type:complete
MEKIDKIKKVRSSVEVFVNDNIDSISGIVTPSDLNHIVNIGTSIMCTKWNIGYEGGSFVQAIVNNDLSKAVSSADGTNIKALKLYCLMMYNMTRVVIN